MPVGQDVSKVEFDTALARVLKDLLSVVNRIEGQKGYLDQISVATMVANWGITTGEANVYKSIITDLGDLRGIFLGAQNLASARDFRTFAKQAYGLGS